MLIDQSTESRILEASKRVFIRKGFEGARMQEIADEAVINKALLHYYFRSKQKLFEAVFLQALQALVPQINEVIESDEDIFTKIESFVKKYNDFLLENPFLPLFVLTEIQRNPSSITNLFYKSDGKVIELIGQLKKLFGNTAAGSLPAEHMFVNIISLTVFPIIARPILQMLLFQNDDSAYSDFMKSRPGQIRSLFKNALSANQGEK